MEWVSFKAGIYFIGHCCWADWLASATPCGVSAVATRPSSGGWVAYAFGQVVHKYNAYFGGLLERLDKAANAGARFANIDPVFGGIAAPEGTLNDLVTFAYALVREVPVVAAVWGL